MRNTGCRAFAIGIVLLLAAPALAQEVAATKIMVDKDAMYRITGAELAEYLSPSMLPVESSKLHLFNQGKTVPITIENLDSDGQFTDLSVIKFWGEAPRGTTTRKYRYSRENAYILRLDSNVAPHRFAKTAPLDRPARSSKVATSYRRVNIIDQDRILEQFPTNNYESDHAVYAKVMAPPNVTRVNLDLAAYASDMVDGRGEFVLRMLLLGGSATAKNLDHDWTVSLGEHVPLGHALWDGFEPFTLEAKLPAKKFVDSSAAASLSFANNHADKSIDVIYLDWIEMRYEAELAAHDGQMRYGFLEGDSRCDSVRFIPSFASENIDVFDLQRETELDIQGVLDPDTGKYYAEYVYPLNGEGGLFVALSGNDYLQPSRIVPVRPESLSKSDQVPEYVVITHESLAEALEPLIRHRREQGLTSVLVDVDQIYNEYSDGLVAPQAVRRYLDELLDKSAISSTKLRYVFLVGAATYDYQDVVGEKTNLVPTYYGPKAEFSIDGTVAYDDYFVLGKDGGAIGVPKVAVGRLPIQDTEELSGFVRKLIAFDELAETRSSVTKNTRPGEPWRERLLMIASFDATSMTSYFGRDFTGWQTTSILAGDGRTPEFTELQSARLELEDEKAQLLAVVRQRVVEGIETLMRDDPSLTTDKAAEKWFESQRVKSGADVGRINELDDEYGRLTTELRKEENRRMQNGIIDAINSGCAVLYFAGHGGAAVWRTGIPDLESRSDMLNYEHVSLLTNGSKCPVVFAATCYSNIYDIPTLTGTIKGGVGIGVSLVKAKTGGAIACVGHVARTEMHTPTRFAILMCDVLFDPQQPAERLGDAFLHAKVTLADHASPFISLVGDPATYFGKTYRANSD